MIDYMIELDTESYLDREWGFCNLCMHKNVDIVKKYVEKYKPDLNSIYDPLMRATMHKNINVIKFLLDNGSIITENSIAHAMDNICDLPRDIEIIKLFIEKGMPLENLCRQLFKCMFSDLDHYRSIESDFYRLILKLLFEKNYNYNDMFYNISQQKIINS